MGFVERKIGCAREFAELLASRLRGRLIKVVLFGSVARGLCDADSDVDVLVVVDRVDEGVKRVVAESAFEASVKFREPIEYIVVELEEYRMKGVGNPFVYEVERYGRALYYDPEPERERVRRLLELAEEYYGYATRCAQQLMYRAAIDLAQNAVELVLKALILAKGEALPRSRGGYIHMFGELYVVKGGVDREVITKLYRALELRNKARYDPDYNPQEADVNEVLQTYREIRGVAREVLEENRTSTKP
jgi:predicted nucleotidyltransferase